MSRNIDSILGEIIREGPDLSVDEIKEIIIDYIDNNIEEIIQDYIENHIDEISHTKSKIDKLFYTATKGFRKEILDRRRSYRESKNKLLDIFDTYIYELINKKKFDYANTISEHMSNIDAAHTIIDYNLQYTDIHLAKLQEEDIKIDNNKTVLNIKKVYNMGDINIAGQAGAQGSGEFHDMNFVQIFNENRIDLTKLAIELAKLRTELKKEATESVHDSAIGDIATAESFAREGNGPKAFESLSKAGREAGKWILDIATKIGIPITIEALKKVMGL